MESKAAESKVPLLKWMNVIPGGTMVFPMLLTALLNTFCPSVLMIGGPTTAAFKTGTLTIAGIILFISGAKVKASQLKSLLTAGGVYAIIKIAIGFGAGIWCMSAFGLDGFAGISTLTFVSCMYSCNPGVFAGVSSEYGDDVDRSMMALIMLLCMQALGVLILEITSGGGFDIMNVVNILAPWLLGFIIGNLDPAFAKLVAPGTNLLLPFLGCCFGASVNLLTALESGLAGILMCAIYLVVNVPIFLAGDKLVLKKPGWCGIAFCSVAGISISLPAIMVANHPEYAPFADTAAAQIALVMVLTSLITPLLCKFAVKKWGATKGSAYDKRQIEASE